MTLEPEQKNYEKQSLLAFLMWRKRVSAHRNKRARSAFDALSTFPELQ
jgi:hypothetical protein